MGAPSTIILGLGLEVGAALAVRFREAGHRVFVADTNEKRVQKARETLADDIEVMQVKPDKLNDIHNVFVRAGEGEQRLNNLVIVPRIPKADRLMALEEADLKRSQFDILALAELAMRRFAESLMDQEDIAEARADQARQRGTITVVLSNTATAALPGQFSTQIVQGAAKAMMRAAALELADRDIRVNAVEALRPRTERERWLDARTPLGRPALADEIADACLFLASQNAAIITGETLVLDGGRSLLSGLLRSVPESDLNGRTED